MNRGAEIAMAAEEQTRFLAESRTIALSTFDGPGEATPGDALRPRAAKRVAIRVHPERIASWGHPKLRGAY